VIRRSQTSNPRSSVVLTSGADWGSRAASQQPGGGTGLPLPRQQFAKVKVLRLSLMAIGRAINTKNWDQARYALNQAKALVDALPLNMALQERKQLSALRKKYAARNTPAAKDARRAKPTSAGRVGSKKPAPKKSATKSAARKPKSAPVRDLGDRFINRTALGYAPADETKGARAQ